MEGSVAKPNGTAIFSASSTKQFSMHRKSHTITKLKPKVRIIHIVVPKIINTDVENFRVLVQRLTGKSDEVKGRTKKNGTRTSDEDHGQEHHILESTAQRSKELQFLFKESDCSTFGKFGDCMGTKFNQDLSQFGMQPFK